MQSRRAALGLTVLFGLGLSATIAFGKGGAGTNLSSTQTDPGDFVSGAYAASSSASSTSSGGGLSSIFDQAPQAYCSTPTAAQCDVPPAAGEEPYANTDCGRRQLRQAWSRAPTGCDGKCHVTTLQDCDDEAWLNTVCGHLEMVRASYPDSCDYLEPALCEFGADGRPVNPLDPLCEWYCPSTDLHPSVCVQLTRNESEIIQADTGSAYTGDDMVNKVVVVPTAPPPTHSPENPLDYGFWNPNTVKREVGVLDRSSAGLQVGNTGRHYWSQGIAETVWRRSDNMLKIAMMEQQRQAWDDNDANWAAGEFAVGGYFETGCREYIYEKYYDYSKFEDQAQRLGGDSRAMFEAAYDADPDAPWAIGTRGMGGWKLRRKDGQNNEDQVLFPSDAQQKNPLFETAVFQTAQDRQAKFNYWDQPFSYGHHRVAYPVGDTVYEAAIPRPFGGRYVYIVDDELDRRLREGRANHKFFETWAWHHTRSAELASAGYIDEELYALDKLKERLMMLLRQRAEWTEIWSDNVKDLITIDGPPMNLLEEFSEFDLGAPVERGDYLSRYFAAQDASAAERSASIGIEGLASAVTAAGGFGAAVAFSAPGAAGMETRSGSLPGGNLGMGGAFNDSADALQTASQAELNNQLLARNENAHPAARAVAAAVLMVGLDERIEALLQDAMARGCVNIDGVDPCDWSPAYFAQRVDDPFMRAREIEYDRCWDYTAEDTFQSLITPDPQRFYVNIEMPDGSDFGYSEVDGRPCDDARFNQGPDQVERYFKCMDKFREDLITALNDALTGGGVLVDPDTREVSIVESTGDEDHFGSDVFNIHYNYEARWEVSELPGPDREQNFCGLLKPRFHGHFDVGARVLVADIALIGAYGDVGMDDRDPKPQAHLEVLGEQLLDFHDTERPSANEYNIIYEDTNRVDEEIFSIGATFVIVVVPLTIAGGVAGYVGANALLAAGAGGAGVDSCDRGGLLIRGQFEPFAGVDAFASVSINAIIVEAGVKITVTIVEVGFPFTVDLKFVAGQTGSGQLDIKMVASTSLDAVFRFLGGRFSAFVEVCFIFCEEWEQTLFSWDPITLKKRLLGTSFEIPLFPLLDYAESQGGGTP